MKVIIFLGLLVSAVMAQEILEVTCGQDAITTRFQKAVAETAEYEMSDLHFSDPECTFEEDDGDYYIKRIEPLLACGTSFTANDTHVTYFNSISSGNVDSSPDAPHGIVVGQPTNPKLISVSLTCTYKIDLRVSTAFIPNITYVFIEIPDVAEFGQFKIAMEIYKTAAYREPYGENMPVLDAEGTVFAGVYMVGDTSPDVYLLLKRCWATVFEEPDSSPFYNLIDEECPITDAVQGSVEVTQNGIGHQALWQSKVFRFVGTGDDFQNVWLHCDVTLCIKKSCKPDCDSRRKRRALEDGRSETKTVSFGPMVKLIIETGNNGIETIVINNNTQSQPSRPANDASSSMNPTILIIIGALAAFCLICLTLALVVVLMRLKRASRGGDGGSVTTTGTINKGFSI